VLSFRLYLNLGRLALILWAIIQVEREKRDTELEAIVLLLLWLRILWFLQIATATRYLVRIMLEIMKDLKVFLLVFGLALVAYAHVSHHLDGGFGNNLKLSYALAFGDIGDSYEEYSALRFFFFICFTFFIPLLMMNLLIAIMSDSYERVQSNAVAADFRSRALLI